MHPKTEIRHEVIRRLRDADSLNDVVFYESRTRPVSDRQDDEKSIGLVYTDQDRLKEEVQLSSSEIGDGNRDELRVVTVTVVLVDESDYDETIEDLMDGLTDAVERVLMEDTRQGGHAVETEFVSGDPFRTAQGQATTGTSVIAFDITYMRSYPVDTV